MPGKFVISLDYELHWGFFDNRSLEDGKETLANVTKVIDDLLKLSNHYSIKITFATVGFLFANNKDEIQDYLPKSKPNYKDSSLDAYKLLESIGKIDELAPYYFAPSGIKKIQANKNHEIGTHTFSHYYCNEEGQTSTDFEQDISAAIGIAKNSGIDIKSIVFPRNQANKDYIKACQSKGLTSFRGSCWFNFNNKTKNLKWFDYPKIALRVLDSYVNLTGSNSYKIEDYNMTTSKIINIPSSRFFRPVNPKLRFLEPLKINRIKRSMTKAAKRGNIYHLWWHPHNFGNNMQENFNNLKHIFEHYKKLQETYGFKAVTMSEIAENA